MLVGAALLAMLAVSACGGSSTASGDGGGDGSGGSLTLVAYSTPEEAFRELIPAFTKTLVRVNLRVPPAWGKWQSFRLVEQGGRDRTNSMGSPILATAVLVDAMLGRPSLS
jgi:ABC-type glycerol-3-phosphate transport system substrate-binding protein